MFPNIEVKKKENAKQAEKFARLRTAPDFILYPFISDDLHHYKDKNGDSKDRAVKQFLTNDEKYRLKEWEKSINEFNNKKKENPNNIILSKIKIYKDENKKIRRQRNHVKKIEPSININEVNSIFEVERIEDDAARKIQRAWFHSKLIFKLRHVFFCMKQAAKIQRCIRGVLARRRVATWFNRRNQLIVNWQCRIRKWRSNKYVRPVLEKERLAAICIQRIVLGKLGRLRWKRIQMNFAATRIQAIWRGVIARAEADRIWLHRVVIPIQKTVRRRVAQSKYGNIKQEKTIAVRKIQRCFRNWRARKFLGTFLHLREEEYRDTQLGILTAEEEWIEEQIVKNEARIEKKQFKEKVAEIMQSLNSKYEDIHFMENDLIELKRQKEILSPRAIQQGWLQQLEKNISQTRTDLTKLKLNTIFTQLYSELVVVEHVDNKIFEVEEMKLRRDMIATWKDQVSLSKYIIHIYNMYVSES
jgi:hypothetical protein